jgi:GT2 family glycosyltransferase
MEASMFVEAVTVSINYADYLAHCIEQNAAILNRWIVVTSVNDKKAQRLCRRYRNIHVVLTTVSYRPGVVFPRSRMINEGFAHLRGKGWVIHLDPDILLPSDTRSYLRSTDLDPTCMYGPEFRWLVNDRGRRIGTQQSDPQFNIGYFQMFHFSSLAPYPETSSDVSRDDMTFNKHWRRSKRLKLPGFAPSHVGPVMTHWNGRSPQVGTNPQVRRPVRQAHSSGAA